jgi:ATP-dependent DNA helicase DinG
LDKFKQILVKDDSNENIRWFDIYKNSFRLTSTPTKIGNVFQQHMIARDAAWVFTSATLAVNQEFTHFEQQLGIVDAKTALWDSPFNYPKQALWFIPRGLPDPNHPDYNQKVSDLIIPIIKASQGRAFLLYTSYKALNEAARYLKNEFDFPLFIQGRMPKAELLAQFKQAGNGVLLGTASFWEGVDVRGEALSCVIIDKLPFASPGDPVLQARIDVMKQNGGNPFMEYQLPKAIISLKQGAGRLIRDHQDQGTLTICDPRLLGRSYGHQILASMPNFARTRVLDDILNFYS